MSKFKYVLFAATLACLLGEPIGLAQTLSVVSGNGQLVCNCTNTVANFLPMVVQATDAANHPVAGSIVYWTLVSGAGSVTNYSTTTASDGTTSNTFSTFFGSGTTLPILSQVTASNGSGSVTFNLTQVFAAVGPGQVVADSSFLPAASGTPVTAISGQQGYSFNGQTGQTFKVGVLTQSGTPLPGVSVRIGNYQSSPSVSCVTGAGADPGSVLTDATGYATCTPIFGGTGNGNFIVLIGGVPDPANPGTQIGNLLGYYLNVPPTLTMQVNAATPASVTVVSGNNQTATAGHALGAALVAAINAQGGGTVPGQSVTWTVSPAAAGTLANPTTTSDINGQASNTLTLSTAASGSVTVTAALTGTPTLKATFTVTAVPLVTLGGLTKISGDAQSAIVGAQFANPLVVQVNSSTGAPVPGIVVSFSATGGAVLSTTSATTGSNGQAQVTVTAPSTAGSLTVTATASGFSQIFNLTAAPPGPTFTSNSFVNAADLQSGKLSPCSLATWMVSGTPATSLGTGNTFALGGLSSALSGYSITVGGTAAPILSVSGAANQQQVTFQVPCTAAAGSTSFAVTTPGGGSGSTNITLLAASPGVFQTGTAASGSPFPLGIFVRPDGSYVTASNPARKGDTIVAYVTGLGPASPAVSTNALPLPTAQSMAVNTLIIGVANAGVPLISAQLSPDLVGVYLVSFQVPTNAPSGNQPFSVGVIPAGAQNPVYSNGAALPIQ